MHNIRPDEDNKIWTLDDNNNKYHGVWKTMIL